MECKVESTDFSHCGDSLRRNRLESPVRNVFNELNRLGVFARGSFGKAAMDESQDSISRWIERIKGGDEESARRLWERYFAKLVSHARRKLKQSPRRAADEEDVALSAFHSFCRAAEAGRFPDLAGRDALWRLLLQMTARKAVDQVRYETRQRRGGGNVQGESAFQLPGGEGDGVGIGEAAGKEPTPEFAAILAEECENRLKQLEDDDLRGMAVAKMEGYSNAEIAERFDCSLRTVERRLNLIRRTWERELSP